MAHIGSRRAFSYLRFSSPEQAKGDSFRRQTALAVEYARTHELDLDESLSFHDLGVSAWRGVNSETGQLSTLLEAVRCGLIPKNSVILVESLDRISRQAARKALRVIEGIVEFGVSVVTLNDGREYTAESLDNDPLNLLIALLTFIRANEESVIKSQRLSAVWAAKRVSAATKPLTSRCPGWVTLCPNRKKFVIIPEYAEIICQIFDAAAAGNSVLSITRRLNADKIPTLHGGGRRAKYWQAPGLSMLLKNPAVIGTFTPHMGKQIDGKMVRTSLEPILHYYPAAVTVETFTCVQQSRNLYVNFANGPGATPGIRNIFAFLGKCAHCGSAMILSSRSGRNRYLVCRRFHLKAGCHYQTVRYHEIENTIIRRFNTLAENSLPPGALVVRARLDRIRTLLDVPIIDRTATNMAMRVILESVTIHPEECRLTLNWKHGGSSNIEAAFTSIRPQAVQ